MKLLIFKTTLFLVAFVSFSIISNSELPLFPVTEDDKWGYIDNSGKLVIALQFDSAEEFHDGLARVTQNGRTVFIDVSGRVVLSPKYDYVGNFSEGLAPVNVGEKRIPNIGIISAPGRWGYIDTNGKLILPLKFTHAEPFSEGVAAVAEGNRTGFIDHSGHMLFEVPFDTTLGFHEGAVAALLRGNVSYFNRTGKLIPMPPIDYGPKSSSFSDGLVAIQTKGRWAYADIRGRIVIPSQFDDADVFSEGLAAVRVTVDVTWCPANANGTRMGTTKRYGYIATTGKIVIPVQFDNASAFSEGLAAVTICNKSGFIDKTGKVVIPLQFDEAFSFNNGLARVRFPDGRLGYIDRNGKTVWSTKKSD